MNIGVNELAYIYQTTKAIAVVGLSPKIERPSHQVAKYLITQGFEVVPVNPGHIEILGKTSYPSLFEIPFPVQIVDVFRRSEDVLPIVRAAIQIEAPYIWLQEGIRNAEAAELANNHNKIFIEDLCIKKMHQKVKSAGLL